MNKTLTRAALAAAVVLTGTFTSPASATSTVYCNPGVIAAGATVWDGVTGTVTYVPPVVSSTVPILTDWTMDVTLVCNNGLPKAAGTYHLVIKGSSSETCAVGGGGGTMDTTQSAKTGGVGQGPVVNGSWRYDRYGLHYYGYPTHGDGDIYVAEAPAFFQHYKVYMWLDLVPFVANGNCPGAGGEITGHAQIVEP